MSRAYDESDYPHGCRCACCNRPFEPLVSDHPFGLGKTPTACADGMVRAAGEPL